MAIIRGSIEADVPLEFADLQWSKFALETLRRDLEKYRRFLLERCERESCRPSGRCPTRRPCPVTPSA